MSGSEPTADDIRRVTFEAPPPSHRTRRSRTQAPTGASSAPPGDVFALRQAIRSEVLAEIEEDRAERSRQHDAQRLGRLLDLVAQFAEEHDLDDRAQEELGSMVIEMHDRMESLRPEGPPQPGGPPPEIRDAIEASIAQLESDALDVLDDPELAAAFVDWLGPPGPRPLRVAD